LLLFLFFDFFFKYEELRLRERVLRLLDDNRSAFNQLLQNCRQNDDVKRCYPAIQFFSSGVEILGKVRF